MFQRMSRKGLMATCLTLLILAWVLLLNSFAAKADAISVEHLVCQTREFAPNVSLLIRTTEQTISMQMILTDESGNDAALSDSQLNISDAQAKALKEKHSGIFKLYDPISGSQLLTLQNGNGYVSFNDKMGKNQLIEVKNCR